VGDGVDVEEDRAGYVARRELGLGIPVLRRQVPGCVDNLHMRVAEMVLQPVDRGEKLAHAALPSIASANASLIRRFWRPFFSILVTTTRPISPVERTCVPPQGWRSTDPSAPIATSLTFPVPVGGLTLMVRTRPGLSASSSSEIQWKLTG